MTARGGMVGRMKTIAAIAVLGTVAITPEAVAQNRPCSPNPEELAITQDSLLFEIGGFPIKLCFQRLPVRAGSGTMSWQAIGNDVPVIHTNVLLDIGGVQVGSGSYGLYLTPQQGEWLLRVVWMPYPGFEQSAGSVADRVVGHIYVPAERIRTPTQSLDIQARGAGRNAILFLTWGDIEVTIPVVQQ
ncbi:MAG: DUF2911 domain-containing protein [Gemmatimonadales bacterium]